MPGGSLSISAPSSSAPCHSLPAGMLQGVLWALRGSTACCWGWVLQESSEAGIFPEPPPSPYKLNIHSRSLSIQPASWMTSLHNLCTRFKESANALSCHEGLRPITWPSLGNILVWATCLCWENSSPYKKYYHHLSPPWICEALVFSGSGNMTCDAITLFL